MPNLKDQLELPRCPHCNVDTPSLPKVFQHESQDYSGGNTRRWRIYQCKRCGGLVTASAPVWNATVVELYPAGQDVEAAIPDRARDYLEQALNSLHSPAGAVMLAASAVDSMLKAKAYRDGSLYARIDKAAQDHIITSDMAQWAHDVRLDANDQRHADDSAPLPSGADARRAIDFALALGQFMFVLPARVQRGIQDAGKNPMSNRADS